MIDEPRDVAADSRVAYPSPIDLETPDLSALHVPALAPQTFLM
jgi:hypothetical protein